MTAAQETLIGNDVNLAAQLLGAGKLVAIPTETVYGLAANIFCGDAVNQIFAVKQRPATNPLIVHIHSAEGLTGIVTDIPQKAAMLMQAFWPGPLTLLLPKNKQVPNVVTAGLPNVAVRMPNHPLTLALLKKVSFPLVAPSANPYTYISPTNALHVKKMLNGKIPYVLDGGPCNMGIESTIVGFKDGVPALYRMGAISMEVIENVIGKITLAITEKAIAPGMHVKHYSPITPLVVSDNLEQDILKYRNHNIGVITYNSYTPLLPHEQQLLLSEDNDFKTAGANLYAAMHTMDGKGYDLIIARKFPKAGIALALNDRLNRARAT
jgi:L-threonylcarbamoyladenylate synthase